jgi:hypothetical protein
MGEFLRHREDAITDAQGFAGLGNLAIALQIGCSELLDAAPVSRHTQKGHRYEVCFEGCDPAIQPSDENKHSISFLHQKCDVRAKHKHSIAIAA